MLRETLKLDNRDIHIISWFMANPEISQKEIAKKLKLSQPSVNVRIRKLRQRGILNLSAGIEFNKSKLMLARADFSTTQPNKMLELFSKCPYFVNCFVSAGKRNVSALMISSDLAGVEKLISTHLRNNTLISNIDVHLMVKSAKDFIFPLDLSSSLPQTPSLKPSGCKFCRKK